MLTVESKVEYFSSQKKWVNARVLAVNPDGTFDLNIKKGVKLDRIRAREKANKVSNNDQNGVANSGRTEVNRGQLAHEDVSVEQLRARAAALSSPRRDASRNRGSGKRGPTPREVSPRQSSQRVRSPPPLQLPKGKADEKKNSSNSSSSSSSSLGAAQKRKDDDKKIIGNSGNQEVRLANKGGGSPSKSRGRKCSTNQVPRGNRSRSDDRAGCKPNRIRSCSKGRDRNLARPGRDFSRGRKSPSPANGRSRCLSKSPNRRRDKTERSPLRRNVRKSTSFGRARSPSRNAASSRVKDVGIDRSHSRAKTRGDAGIDRSRSRGHTCGNSKIRKACSASASRQPCKRSRARRSPSKAKTRPRSTSRQPRRNSRCRRNPPKAKTEPRRRSPSVSKAKSKSRRRSPSLSRAKSKPRKRGPSKSKVRSRSRSRRPRKRSRSRRGRGGRSASHRSRSRRQNRRGPRSSSRRCRSVSGRRRSRSGQRQPDHYGKSGGKGKGASGVDWNCVMSAVSAASAFQEAATRTQWMNAQVNMMAFGMPPPTQPTLPMFSGFGHFSGGTEKTTGTETRNSRPGGARIATEHERPGDWSCPSCGASVFASKRACFKCGTQRDGTPGSKGDGKGQPPAPEKFSEELWEAPRSGNGLRLLGEIAIGTPWHYLITDESRRSFIGHLRSPFKTDECQAFFKDVLDGVDWKQPAQPSGALIPRKTAWLVSSGCSCSYRYGSIEVEACPYTPWMTNLMQRVMPLCGLEVPAQWPTSCNINLYEDGGMSVGWHTDDERLFQGKFQDIRIISLSLGVTRKFEVRTNWPQQGERSHQTLMLADGDLCTMEGMFQKHFQHRVPKEDNIQGPRINLTWRWVVKHTPKCPAGRRRW